METLPTDIFNEIYSYLDDCSIFKSWYVSPYFKYNIINVSFICSVSYKINKEYINNNITDTYYTHESRNSSLSNVKLGDELVK